MTTSLSTADYSAMQELTLRVRQHVLRMIKQGRSSHIGSSYSAAELYSVLYSGIVRNDPADPENPDRDRMVLSKGHACAGLYAVLAERGFFPMEWLDSFYVDGAKLPGHATHWGIPGIEVSSGSLGHGLSVGAGMAYAAKVDNKDYRTFCVLSDGECDEGSTWEAAMFAPHHHLDNLVCIIDYNKIQSLGHVKDILSLEPFAEKWRSFGWSVQGVDGHNVKQLYDTLASAPWQPGKPSCIISHTIKGRGVEFMEDQVLWHYRCPDDGEFEQAKDILGM